METTIIIPSHKRAGKVTTLKHLPEGCATLCVADDQADAYRVHGAPLLVHSSDLLGIWAKRQWILDQFEGKSVVMIDDDCERVVRVNRQDGNCPIARKSTVDPETTYELIWRTAETARRIGAKFFGWNTHSNPVTYKPLRPFSMGGYMMGGAHGYLPGHKIRYPVDILHPGADHYASALNAYHDRYSFRDRRFAFAFAGTYTASGGLAEFRSEDGEAKAREFLLSMFGDAFAATPNPQKRVTKRRHNGGARKFKEPWPC